MRSDQLLLEVVHILDGHLVKVGGTWMDVGVLRSKIPNDDRQIQLMALQKRE